MSITRRTALTGLLASAAFTAWSTPGRASSRSDRRLVVILLRGGLDGLHAVPAIGDPDYAAARGRVALPSSEVLELDGLFGLHPALAPLMPLWNARQLSIVHATSMTYRGRSHFDAQQCLESGSPKPGQLSDGFLNRALASLGPSWQGDALSLTSSVPLILRGTSEVKSYDPRSKADPRDDFLSDVARLYEGDTMLFDTLSEGLATRELVESAMDAPGRGGRRSLRPSIEAASTLLTQADGPRIAFLEAGGWDSHSNQGRATGGLANRLTGLADGLIMLRDRLGPAWSRTAVLVVTEFGRTVRGNGTGGTDHGTGGAAFLAGGAVQGGRVIADWPGLAQRDLHQGRDLRSTTDLRALFGGVLHDHLGVSRAALGTDVFPGSGGLPLLRDLIA